MFFFKSSATANYEKKIYDFSIESITGETINFKDYKNKVILVIFKINCLTSYTLYAEVINFFFIVCTS